MDSSDEDDELSMYLQKTCIKRTSTKSQTSESYDKTTETVIKGAITREGTEYHAGNTNQSVQHRSVTVEKSTSIAFNNTEDMITDLLDNDIKIHDSVLTTSTKTANDKGDSADSVSETKALPVKDNQVNVILEESDATTENTTMGNKQNDTAGPAEMDHSAKNSDVGDINQVDNVEKSVQVIKDCDGKAYDKTSDNKYILIKEKDWQAISKALDYTCNENAQSSLRAKTLKNLTNRLVKPVENASVDTAEKRETTDAVLDIRLQPYEHKTSHLINQSAEMLQNSLSMLTNSNTQSASGFKKALTNQNVAHTGIDQSTEDQSLEVTEQIPIVLLDESINVYQMGENNVVTVFREGASNLTKSRKMTGYSVEAQSDKLGYNAANNTGRFVRKNNKLVFERDCVPAVDTSNQSLNNGQIKCNVQEKCSQMPKVLQSQFVATPFENDKETVDDISTVTAEVGNRNFLVKAAVENSSSHKNVETVKPVETTIDKKGLQLKKVIYVCTRKPVEESSVNKSLPTEKKVVNMRDEKRSVEIVIANSSPKKKTERQATCIPNMETNQPAVCLPKKVPSVSFYMVDPSGQHTHIEHATGADLDTKVVPDKLTIKQPIHKPNDKQNKGKTDSKDEKERKGKKDQKTKSANVKKKVNNLKPKVNSVEKSVKEKLKAKLTKKKQTTEKSKINQIESIIEESGKITEKGDGSEAITNAKSTKKKPTADDRANGKEKTSQVKSSRKRTSKQANSVVLKVEQLVDSNQVQKDSGVSNEGLKREERTSFVPSPRKNTKLSADKHQVALVNDTLLNDNKIDKSECTIPNRRVRRPKKKVIEMDNGNEAIVKVSGNKRKRRVTEESGKADLNDKPEKVNSRKRKVKSVNDIVKSGSDSAKGSTEDFKDTVAVDHVEAAEMNESVEQKAVLPLKKRKLKVSDDCNINDPEKVLNEEKVRTPVESGLRSSNMCESSVKRKRERMITDKIGEKSLQKKSTFKSPKPQTKATLVRKTTHVGDIDEKSEKALSNSENTETTEQNIKTKLVKKGRGSKTKSKEKVTFEVGSPKKVVVNQGKTMISKKRRGRGHDKGTKRGHKTHGADSDDSWKELLSGDEFKDDFDKLQNSPVKHINVRKVIKHILKPVKHKRDTGNRKANSGQKKIEEEVNDKKAVKNINDASVEKGEAMVDLVQVEKDESEELTKNVGSKYYKQLTEEILARLKERSSNGLHTLKECGKKGEDTFTEVSCTNTKSTVRERDDGSGSDMKAKPKKRAVQKSQNSNKKAVVRKDESGACSDSLTDNLQQKDKDGNKSVNRPEYATETIVSQGIKERLGAKLAKSVVTRGKAKSQSRNPTSNRTNSEASVCSSEHVLISFISKSQNGSPERTKSDPKHVLSSLSRISTPLTESVSPKFEENVRSSRKSGVNVKKKGSPLEASVEKLRNLLDKAVAV